jgi:hypothetical protein
MRERTGNKAAMVAFQQIIGLGGLIEAAELKPLFAGSVQKSFCTPAHNSVRVTIIARRGLTSSANVYGTIVDNRCANRWALRRNCEKRECFPIHRNNRD